MYGLFFLRNSIKLSSSCFALSSRNRLVNYQPVARRTSSPFVVNVNYHSASATNTQHQEHLKKHAHKQSVVQGIKRMKVLMQSHRTIHFIDFEEIKELVQNVPTETATSVMRTCSQLLDRTKEERLCLVEILCKRMMAENSGSSACLVPYIESLGNCGEMIADPLEFLDKYSVAGDVEVCESLLRVICENGQSMEAGLEFFDQLLGKSLQLTEASTVALIVGHKKHSRSLEKCNDSVQQMRERGIDATSRTFVELVKAHIELNDSLKSLNELDCFDAKNFSTNQIYDIIETAALHRNEGVLKELLKCLPDTELENKIVSTQLRNVCIQLLYRQIDPFDALLQHLPIIKENLNFDIYGAFVADEMYHMNKPASEIFAFCRKLYDSKRNVYAFHRTLGFAYRQRSPSGRDFLAAFVQQTGTELSPQYYRPLLCQAKDENEVLDALQFSIGLRATLEPVSFERYVLRLIPETACNSLATAKRLQDYGVPIGVVKTALISYLLKNCRFHEASIIANELKSPIDPMKLENRMLFVLTVCDPTIEHVLTISKLLISLYRANSRPTFDFIGSILSKLSIKETAKDFERTRVLIDEFRKANIKISQTHADDLLTRMKRSRAAIAKYEPIIHQMTDANMFDDGQALETSSACKMLTIDELAEHLNQLESSGLCLDGKKKAHISS